MLSLHYSWGEIHEYMKAFLRRSELKFAKI